MAYILLGNSAPVQAIREDSSSDKFTKVPLDVEGAVTKFSVPSDAKLAEAIITVTSVFSQYHSDAPADWVDSDDPILAEAVAQHYTSDEHTCHVGQPTA